MKSNITINIEFLAGTEVKDANTEAKEKAILLNVAYVIFDFNRVSFSIGQNADINSVMTDWERRLDNSAIIHS